MVMLSKLFSKVTSQSLNVPLRVGILFLNSLSNSSKQSAENSVELNFGVIITLLSASLEFINSLFRLESSVSLKSLSQ